MATEGGAILADSVATIYSSYDIFEYNTAIQNGGVFIIMTRSVFYLNNVKFRYNYAKRDSGITAYKTSYLERFLISNCEFYSNYAISNTFSFFDTIGDIDSTVFVNNYGRTSSENIFISFSSLNITNSKFKMSSYTNQSSIAITK